jgi:hypothetical protein
LDSNKLAIEKIIGLEDWSKFEEFISQLYKKHSQTKKVIKNYKTQGKSGRNREVGVLVKLGIDKFAIVTTEGYERGADLYAKDQLIDLFIIRPVNDDDFGYTGQKINIRFQAYGSAFTDIQYSLRT